MNSCKKHAVIDILNRAKGCFFFAKSESCLREEEVKHGVLSLDNLHPPYFEERNSFFLNSQLFSKTRDRVDMLHHLCSTLPPKISRSLSSSFHTAESL